MVIIMSRFLKAIDYYNPDISLEHHGVKGMRWGVRTQKPYVPVGQRQESVEPSYDSDYDDESYSRPVSNIRSASPTAVKKKSHWVKNVLLIAGGAAVAVAATLGAGAIIKNRKENAPDSILTEEGAALKNFIKGGKKK